MGLLLGPHRCCGQVYALRPVEVELMVERSLLSSRQCCGFHSRRLRMLPKFAELITNIYGKWVSVLKLKAAKIARGMAAERSNLLVRDAAPALEEVIRMKDEAHMQR